MGLFEDLKDAIKNRPSDEWLKENLSEAKAMLVIASFKEIQGLFDAFKTQNVILPLAQLEEKIGKYKKARDNKSYPDLEREVSAQVVFELERLLP